MNINMQSENWNIIVSDSTEVYVSHGIDFVARFKYANPKRSANHFVKFLEKNFTPAEYFAERAKGVAPRTILEAKGYVSYNVTQSRG
jgi:hypothetical protein